MNCTDALAEIAAQLSLPLALDANGCARLVFDSVNAVDIEATGEEKLLLYAHIIDLPADHRESILLALLAGNLFGTQTAGATLALDKTTNEILLWREVDLEGRNASALTAALESFIAAVEEWKRLGKEELLRAGRSGRSAPSHESSNGTASAAAKSEADAFIRV